MAHVADYKKKKVADIVNLINQYSIIGAVNMENLPAPQLQRMRAQLRDQVEIAMTKKRLIRIALEEAKKTKKGVEELEKYLEGMPALIFTKENPFKLFKILQKNKSSAPAKAGQKAPSDIVIPKGPTSFSPGPIISELGQIGIKAGVDKGKVAVKEDSVVAKKGDVIKAKLAEVLTKLGIEPMEVGLDLVAVYEDGTIYGKEVLAVDETEFMNRLSNAARHSFNLAMFIEYPTKDTINQLIGKAFNDAKAIGLSQEIIDEGIIEELLAKSERSALSLKSTAKIEVSEKVKEKKIEEPKKEEKKPEVKKVEEPVKEEKKEEVKKEEKIEKPKEEKKKLIEKKEEKALEEEKKIIEEEKELEKETAKPKIEAAVEKEVEKEVKEEEEKQLEKERIEKEKEIEKIEEKKAEKETIPSVEKLVKQTKDFIAGKKEPSADELIKEVKTKEEKKKEKKEIPTAAELAAKKKKEEMETAEKLAKELIKKGTLRK